MTSTAPAGTEQVCVTLRTRSREVLYSIAGNSAVLTDTFRLPQSLQADAPPCRFQFIIHLSSCRWYGRRSKINHDESCSRCVAPYSVGVQPGSAYRSDLYRKFPRRGLRTLLHKESHLHITPWAGTYEALPSLSLFAFIQDYLRSR